MGTILDLSLYFSKNQCVVTVYSRFQLEAEKLGRHIVFQVTVYQKTTKNRSVLFAETQCSDPYQFLVQFIIRDCTDFDELLSKFLDQLDYRGYAALRYRIRGEGKWNEWIAIPPRPSARNANSHEF